MHCCLWLLLLLLLVYTLLHGRWGTSFGLWGASMGRFVLQGESYVLVGTPGFDLQHHLTYRQPDISA